MEAGRIDRTSSVLIFAVFALMLASQGTVQAQHTNNPWTLAGAGDWFEPTHWEYGVPQSTHNAWIGNGGAAQLSDPDQDATIWDLRIGINPGDPLCTVDISDGAQLMVRGEGQITASINTEATLTVRGQGSRCTVNNPLSVGHGGIGTLRVESGGQVSSYTGFVGRWDVANGTAVITGGGSLWDVSDNLFIGYEGQGELRIESGGLVECDSASIGRKVDSEGTVVVSGAGSRWHVLGDSSELEVGDQGSGTLRIEAGAEVLSPSVCVGRYSLGDNAVVVTGPGSSWTCGSLVIGYMGRASMRIDDGAVVTSGYADVADQGGSVASVVISGQGSQWTTGGGITIGGGGQGTLRVESGGRIEAAYYRAGWGGQLRATVEVVGQGSICQTGGDFFLSRADMTVLDGAELQVDGELTITSLGSLTLQDGILTAATVLDTGGGVSQWRRGTIRLGVYEGDLLNQGCRLESLRGEFGLTILGNLVQQSDAALICNIDGRPDSGLFDLFSVQGTADLDGALVLDFSDFRPQGPLTYHFLDGSGILGTFEDYVVIGLDPSLVSYDIPAGDFTVVPEPATVSLLALGLSALFVRRGRRR